MIPDWLHILSIASLLVAMLAAVAIALDVRRDPQPMWIMNLVWPLTALFAGPLALAFYFTAGKGGTMSAHHRGGHAHSGSGTDEGGEGGETPFPIAVAKGTLHCGSGCTLGDIIAEWLAFFVPAVAVWFGWQWLFADKIFAVWVLDFVLAFLFGVAFQYFSIKPMRDLTPRAALVAAVKADALSLTAWQVGMYGAMALAHFVLFQRVLGASLEVPSVEFWFVMQLAMLCGFVTAYPVNWWLVRRGIKERM